MINSQENKKNRGNDLTLEDVVSQLAEVSAKVDYLTKITESANDRISFLTRQIDEDTAFGNEGIVVVNRRAFYRESVRMARLARRHDFEACLLYVNIVRFRDINAAFGRRGGDAVLDAVAHELQNLLRTTDVVGRLGADEFGALIVHAESADAVAQDKASRLTSWFAINPVPYLGKQIPVALMTGIQVLEKSMSIDQMIERAVLDTTSDRGDHERQSV